MEVLVFVNFYAEEFQSVFQNKHKDWTADSNDLSKIDSSEEHRLFLFLHCPEQKLCELKRVQLVLFHYRKYFFQWSQLNFGNSLVDGCQIVWTLINWADFHSNNESPNCYRSCICLSNESNKHPRDCYFSHHKATFFSCTVANDLWSLQMLVDFPFLCNWIFSHYSSS